MPDAAPPVLTVVLAAGLATRFGGGKLDAKIGETRVGSWSINALEKAGLAPGIIVVGPRQPQFCSEHPRWRCIVNPEPEAGIGSSIKVALRFAEQQKSEALMIALADMPMVTPEHFRSVAGAQGLAATRYHDGRLGVPARIPKAVFSELADSCGQRGANDFLATHASVQAITTDMASLVDIDTPQDLTLCGQLGRE